MRKKREILYLLLSSATESLVNKLPENAS